MFGPGEWGHWRGFDASPAGALRLLKVHGSTDWYRVVDSEDVVKLRHPMPLFGGVHLHLPGDAGPLSLGSALVLPSREKLKNLPPFPTLSHELYQAAQSRRKVPMERYSSEHRSGTQTSGASAANCATEVFRRSSSAARSRTSQTERLQRVQLSSTSWPARPSSAPFLACFKPVSSLTRGWLDSHRTTLRYPSRCCRTCARS